MAYSLPRLSRALSQLDLVAVDSRKLGPSRLAAAVVVASLVAATLGPRSAVLWGASILVCEGLTWAVTGPFSRGERITDARRGAYMVSSLCGCAVWLALSLAYWNDATHGSAFVALLIWSSLLLNAISFAFRSNFALVMFAAPVSLIMVVTPVLAPRFPGPQQAMALVGLMILAVYAAICAGRNVKAAGTLADAVSELERARADAQAANEAKSAFLATMSHEIRTPLNGVLGMAQAMAREPLPEAQKARLEVISQSGETLLALLNDLLDLARVETGRLALEDGVADLGGLGRQAQATFAPQAADKGIDLRLHIAAELEGGWRGDSIRVRQILFNLVSNAVKFTARGAVDIRLSTTPAGVLIEVADTGPGIAAATLPTLFDRFIQADASTTRRFGGSGLGLAISSDLATLMGGRISVESTLGKGSTFTVVLPLERATTAPNAAPSEPAALEAAGALRVLAAEDNPMNQLVLRTLLEQAGVSVTFAGDGVEALKVWLREPWHLILMDVQMPVMDGPTATRAIRQEEKRSGRARTPIVALTANAMPHQHAEYLTAGMDAVVAKPLQVAELFAAMSLALGQDEAAT